MQFKNISIVFFVTLLAFGCSSGPAVKTQAGISSSAKERSKELVIGTPTEQDRAGSPVKENTPVPVSETGAEKAPNEQQTNKVVLSVLAVEITSPSRISNTLREQCNTLVVSSAKNYGSDYQIVSPKSLAATLDILEEALQYQYEPPAEDTYTYPNVLLKTICIIPDQRSIDITAMLIEQKNGVILKQASTSGLLKDLPLLIDRVSRNLFRSAEKLIIIDSYPQGADAHILEGNNYKNYGKTPIFVYLKNEEQHVQISLKKKGYIELQKSLSIGTDSGTFTLYLQPETNGFVFFLETAVPDARIYINDEYVGITDKNGRALLPPLREGTYNLAITAKGYKPYQGFIEISRLNFSRTITVQLEKQ